MYQISQEQATNDIIAAKNNNKVLNASVTDDKFFGGLFANIASTVGGVIAKVTGIFDAFLVDMDNKRKTSLIPNKYWIGHALLNYQEGYELTQINGQTSYSVEDDTAKIVKLVGWEDLGIYAIYKVAKLDSNNNIIPLSNTPGGELDGVINYKDKILPPGIYIELRSVNGDTLEITGTCRVNGTIINTNGELVSNTSVKPVEEAVKTLMLSYTQANGFNDTLYESEIVSAVTNTSGVVGFTISDLVGKRYGSVVGRDFKQNLPSSDVPYAGYYGTITFNITYVN